ncbi:MAG TPA: methyltransferase domain-containing protein, partial [Ignavibacteriaceae bacterium]|nr:methyltransferase domain-containing protein [Ignavibacteriaceae bacterium]
LNNPDLDEGHVITDNKLSFDDNYFDVVVSDYVLEHVKEPDIFFKELQRVLKPGGYFFFRTPNKNHYVTIISKLTPHRFHKLIANKARGLPKEAPDPYETFYYLNDPKTILNYAKNNNFKNIELRFCEAQPSYLMFNSFFFLIGVAYERIVNKFDFLKYFKSNIFGKLVK